MGDKEMIRFASFNIISPIKSDTELLWAPDGIAFVFLRVLTQFPGCCWLGCAGDVLKRNRRKKKCEMSDGKSREDNGPGSFSSIVSVHRRDAQRDRSTWKRLTCVIRKTDIGAKQH